MEQSNSSAPPRWKPGSFIVLGLLCVALAAVFAGFAIDPPGAEASASEPGTAVLNADPSPLAVMLWTVLAAVFALAGLVAGVVGAIRVGLRMEDTDALARRQTELLKTIAERMLHSDTAKQIAYREEDLALIRETIRKDISKGDFEAAMVLVQALAHTYGYREEAEKYREEIDQARNAQVEAKITEEVARFDDQLARHEFSEANLTAAKLQRLYPHHERVTRLTRRVIEARDEYKRHLERRFLEAARREDLDEAMRLMVELDKYLTEKEAEPFRETARGVIGKQRDNLGVQFKMAVHDREWTAAVQAGEQIIQDFPNSRMADEVRGMIDLLRERAAGQLAAHRG